MTLFDYAKVDSAEAAVREGAERDTRFIAGGTNLLDLMKLQIETPAHLIDVNGLKLDTIEPTQDGGLRIGALVRNTVLAADRRVRRDYGVLSRALLAGASGQLRNRATTAGVKPAQAALWQNLAIALVSLPLAWSALPTVRALDWLWIALLGLLYTALAHSLFVASLRVLNARSASVVFALEPVYGIAFAWWLFNEQPNLRMLFGGSLILLATLISARLSKRAASVEDLG